MRKCIIIIRLEGPIFLIFVSIDFKDCSYVKGETKYNGVTKQIVPQEITELESKFRKLSHPNNM